MADYDIRELREEDVPSVLETFEVVFGEEGAQGADGPARTRAQWDWAYRENPGGLRCWVAAHEGKVVAQYAGRPYRAWFDGRRTHFTEIVDSMVHPDHRAGLKSPGLFVVTALPFFDAYGGMDKDIIHHGWPIETAYRIGKLFLEYNVFRTQTVLVREPAAGPTQPPAEVEELASFPAEVHDLYERCRADWGASVIRDAEFLDWRFTRNPHHDYTVFAVRGADGGLDGYAVYRCGTWHVPDCGMIVDWLVRPDEPRVAELLRDAVLARARADGATNVPLFLPEWSPWFARFQEWGWIVFPTAYYHVGRSFDPRYDIRWLRENWWFTLADSDLV